MPEQETIGQRINYVRTQQGFTLERLAERAGLSKSFIWGVEHDRTGISGSRLLQVADALGASVDYLLRGGSIPEHHQAQSIEVPLELSEVAEELGLTYRQTLTLLEVERSIIARRSNRARTRKSKEEWRSLYEAVSDFLEEGH